MAFAKTGVTSPDRATHTLDLAGAAYATAHVALALGNTTLATKLLALSGYSLNAYNTTTCLLKNRTEAYYEGTYMNYGQCLKAIKGNPFPPRTSSRTLDVLLRPPPLLL